MSVKQNVTQLTFPSRIKLRKYLLHHSAPFPTCVLCSDVFLSQLTLLPNLTLANQWTLKLPASEAVHHIMTFDPNDSNFLYLMTSHHVRTWLRARVSTPSVDSSHPRH